VKTIHALSEFPSVSHPIALTIGNFDGVHRGHQALLHRLHALAGSSGTRAVIAFRNHPSQVLRPGREVPLLCTEHHKAMLLERHGVDLLLYLTFDQKLSQQSPTHFLAQLHQAIPFTYLVLGYDARFGKNREGTPEAVRLIAEDLGFIVEYLEPIEIDGAPLSSTRIREAIHSGHLEQAELFLGRKVSFYSKVHAGAGQGRNIGYPTANLEITDLILPPYGVYVITLTHHGITYPGVANLGLAPTIQEQRHPVLEAHLFNFSHDLYEQEVEVTLHQFLRPEQRFPSIDALKAQIAQDIQKAKECFSLKQE
jgi:riboflavin kinase/FMN adenylyltransferase